MLPYVRVTLHATRLVDSGMEQQAIDTARINIRANIDSNSEFDAAYIIMNGLAAVVACYGLFENSPAVVIGAMIIAMLLGPIAGISLGLVDKNSALVRKALPTLVGGFLVVYGTAFLLGMIHREFLCYAKITSSGFQPNATLLHPERLHPDRRVVAADLYISNV